MSPTGASKKHKLSKSTGTLMSDDEKEEPTTADIMKFLRGMEASNKERFSNIRSDLSNFEARVGREFQAVHGKLNAHEIGIAELRDSVHLLNMRVDEHDEMMHPSGGEGGSKQSSLSVLTKLAEKDLKFLTEHPAYPDTLAVGPTADSRGLSAHVISEYFLKSYPDAKIEVKKKGEGSDSFTVQFQAAKDESGEKWAQRAKELRFRSRRDIGAWIGQEYEMPVRVFLSSLNGFGARLKRLAGPKRQFDFSVHGCFLVANGVVIGSPSMLPPHHKWDAAATKLLQMIDAYTAYFDSEKPVKDQMPEDIALYLAQFKMTPKLAVLQG